jgi:hypothetical protein
MGTVDRHATAASWQAVAVRAEEEMTSKRNTWRSYEDVAVYLLDQIASKLDLDRVEDKQKVIGKRSGTEREIDGKGVKVGNEGFVIIELLRVGHRSGDGPVKRNERGPRAVDRDV